MIDEAFIAPIRTVMLIDDRFPTLGRSILAADERDASEWARAARLWKRCRDRGWLTDVYSDYDWSDKDIDCIVGSDLIVLDYHLEGNEDQPADASRRLLARLADAPHTNLVVIYTSRQDLDVVQDEVIAGLRGRLSWNELLGPADGPLRATFDELVAETGILARLDADRTRLHAYAAGDGRWTRPLSRDVHDFKREVARNGGDASVWEDEWPETLLTALMEYSLAESYGAPLEGPRMVRAGVDVPWVECGNVFVTFVTKANDPDAEEAEAIVTRLEDALTAWGPSPLRAAVALARAEVRRAGLEGESLSAPSPMLEASWWYALFGADTATDRARRARQIATDLVAQVGEVVADRVADFIQRRAKPDPGANGTLAMTRAAELAGLDALQETLPFDLGHTLNAFLSCTPQRPQRVSCGTVFVIESAEKPAYFVCATPACDMVPRRPSANYRWSHALHPWGSMVALSLSVVRKKQPRLDAVRDATINRWLFVTDVDTQPPERLILRLRPDAATEQLAHEVMLVDLSRQKDGIIRLRRLAPGDDGPTTIDASARIIAQLRPPFAEHVLHQAGQHLSRIGTDFFGVPARLFRGDR